MGFLRVNELALLALSVFLGVIFAGGMCSLRVSELALLLLHGLKSWLPESNSIVHKPVVQTLSIDTSIGYYACLL